MKEFSLLYDELDGTTKTNAKIQAIVNYLQMVPDQEKMFAISILIGNKPKRPIKTTTLREWTSVYTGIPLWLFEECYYVVGDLGETISTLVFTDTDIKEDIFTLKSLFEFITQLKEQDPNTQQEILYEHWPKLARTPLYIFNKMLTGSFRIGVSKKIVIKAIAKYLQIDENTIAHQMMGNWDPFVMTFSDMFHGESAVKDHIPYPFFLAYPLEDEPETLGPISDWYLEKKLDGIRGQIICRNGQIYIYTRGEELVTDKFPEFEHLPELLPNGTVLDGEIIPWKDNEPLPFSVMQTRIGRKNVTKKYLQEAPLVMVCYDLLEFNGEDIRNKPIWERKNSLKNLIEKSNTKVLLYSDIQEFNSWEDAKTFRKNARNFNAEGLMLKHKDSIYDVGRKKSGWWKWKSEPLTIDAVLIYAQSGHGRRANLFTDYTFAVWDGELLVPFAKAYSGLTDKEINQLDRWIKQNTIDKFGPVRSVKPFHVFEIAFEGINKSTRHKSGVALRFPRILRWRTDKDAKDANTKLDLLAILNAFES